MLVGRAVTRGGWWIVGLAAALTVPGVALALGAFDASEPARAVVFGVAIVGAAFLLSWAAEAVQLDFSQGLALALLALIAILPEYVVDATFAWLAAEDPSYAGYAVANMTGANRLLIGIAWPMVIVIAWLRFRRRSVELDRLRRPGEQEGSPNDGDAIDRRVEWVRAADHSQCREDPGNRRERRHQDRVPTASQP